MQIRTTEMLHDAAPGLDARPLPEIARVLFDGQVVALGSVQSALGEISDAAGRVSDCLKAGGSLHYAAAGSSGLMAAADAMEIPGTYGVSPNRINIVMPGGVPTTADMPGGTEDDASDGAAKAAAVGQGDAVIVVTASGSTPFAMGFAREARTRGGMIVAIANNSDAPLFAHADVSVALLTPPEVIAGSTRMGAGTAQKAALNILSTLVGVALGHVHDGMMINVRADNAKLMARAQGMVSRIAGVEDSAAATALTLTDGDVKPAVLVASGVATAEDARTLLTETKGNLRAALSRVKLSA